MIVDIHSHLESRDQNPAAREELLADMKRNGIDKRVVSAAEGTQIQEQNSDVSRFVSAYPEQLIGCAVINPKSPGCIEDALHAVSLPGMKMFEFQPVEHGYYPDSCDHIEEILCIAQEHQFTVKMFTGIGSRSMPQQWLGHVRRHPELPFLFLHMGCFDYGYGCIDLAAEYDNIYLETSNQFEVQIIKKAILTLPEHKLVFGSSYPRNFTACSMHVFDLFELTEEHKDKIFRENYRKFI